MPGPRRARIVTRDNLINRLARIMGSTWTHTYDQVRNLTDEQLREAVELEESKVAQAGRHAAFRGSQQWTGGLTR